MSVLSFTLSEEGVTGLRDSLICLSKFCDEVSLEATQDRFMLSAINQTKSAYSCFSFNTSRFFSKYKFTGLPGNDKFYCRLYSRVLIAIFRGRSTSTTNTADGKDGPTERPATIDHCSVTIEDGPNIKSRLIVRMVFRNGCTATHRLMFESTAVVHARFNVDEAHHRWVIASRTLRQIMEHFGPGVELLDINSDGEHINFNCYTEKALNADEVLKKPLQTSIAVDLDEFVDIQVEVDLHVIISVRDFRAVVQHAGLLGTDLRARYSVPERPIRFAYDGDAINCEFLLMTVGERGAAGAQKTTRKKKDQPVQPQLLAQTASGQRRETMATAPKVTVKNGQRARGTDQQPAIPSMGPPPVAASASGSGSGNKRSQGFFDIRPQMTQTTVPRASLAAVEDGLFVADDGWEPVRVEEEEEEQEDDFGGTLGWDTSVREETMGGVTGRAAEELGGERSRMGTEEDYSQEGYESTQRLSDVEKLGLFYGLK